MAAKDSAPALDDVKTERAADEALAGRDSPKRQGDKLGVAASTSGQAAAADPLPGESPKRHGDALQHAVDEAAKD